MGTHGNVLSAHPPGGIAAGRKFSMDGSIQLLEDGRIRLNEQSARPLVAQQPLNGDAHRIAALIEVHVFLQEIASVCSHLNEVQPNAAATAQR